MSIDWSQIKTFRAGTTNLVAALCEELGLGEIINRLVTWDEKQCSLSPGTLAKAVLINIMDDRQALWRVEEYFAQRDTEALLGKGVTPDLLNDDALGRMLDRIAAAGPKQVFTQVVLAAIKTHHLDLRHVHADTTSWSVAGAYSKPGNLKITYGHSKDARPDLKQIMFGLTVNREGVPILGQVLGGNTSDKTWNQDTIGELRNLLSAKQLAEVVYVADAAMVTKTNLALLAQQQLQFVSRLPANFGLIEELKQAAWAAGNWTVVGALTEKKEAAQYRVQEFYRDLYGRPYRFLVVHSDQLDARKEHTLKRLVQRERQELEAVVAALQQQTFDCLADAERAAQDFKAAGPERLHPVHVEVREVKEVKRGRGRPHKDAEPPVAIHFRIQASVMEPDPERLAAWRARASLFVLITNLAPAKYAVVDVMREYKEQAAVELRFRFLKSPFFVDQLYVKNNNRVEALAYLVLIAVLIGSLLERRVRQALTAVQAELVVPGGVRRVRPTIQALLDMFDAVLVHALVTPSGLERHLPANTPPETLKVLQLAGFSESIYTRPYAPGCGVA